MNSIFWVRSIGISALRRAPSRAFEQAGDEAVVVLNHNRPAGYIVSIHLMSFEHRVHSDTDQEEATSVKRSNAGAMQSNG